MNHYSVSYIIVDNSSDVCTAIITLCYSGARWHSSVSNCHQFWV